MNLVSLGVEVILGYVAVLVLFSVLTYIQYTVKYHKAKKSVKNYYEELTQLSKIYGREEIKNLQPEELQEDIKNDSITRIKTANKEFIQPV